MKITGKHPKKLNDPIIGNPAMHGKRWKIDYAYGPHTSYGKLSKRQVDEFAVNNMDTWIDTKHNDVDIGYNEFYEDLKPDNKLTGGVGDATASHNVDPVELSLGQSVEMEHTINPDIATEIALDHLSEDPKYYTKLRKAGLAKELDLVSSSSGFGDPDHPINNKKRLGSDITCTAGNNIVGKIGNTPDGHVEGFSDKTAIIKNKNLKQMNTDDFTVDLDIEEPALDEGKNSPTNKKLWSRALAAARSKFNVYPSAYANAYAAKWYKKNGGGWRKTKSNESLNEASNSGGIITGQNPVGKVSTGKQSNSTSTSTSTSTGQSQTTNPKINSGYQASKGPVEGSGEESLHDRPYNFFQYKRDNAKFGNGNIIKKSGRVSLSELAKQILNNTKDESGK